MMLAWYFGRFQKAVPCGPVLHGAEATSDKSAQTSGARPSRHFRRSNAALTPWQGAMASSKLARPIRPIHSHVVLLAA
jgi:hypothetical protein